MSQIGSAIIVQGRVINALMLREIHTVHGDSRLGYVWILIQSAFNIAVFWAIRAFAGVQAPHGMAMPFFLATGFSLFFVFSSGINKCLTAREGNRGLLTFPQVTLVDVMIARICIIAATHLIVLIVISTFAVAWGYNFVPGSLGLVCFAFVCTAFLSFGVGLIVTSFTSLISGLDKFVPMVLRIMFFISGLFFSVEAFSTSVSSILLLNPLIHLIELLREGMHVTYRVATVSLIYPALFTLATLSFGLLVERYVRRRRLSL